ncbi:Uncharacterized protein OS=Singulisphaera acidiphila (strain ATCC BAA-1392 / DSM 18658 / VKM B-2454 / MOB10) GN=Sinac_4599 PE=4 SV=1: DUF2382 [Gemmata massiliana]|uniref:DUF2382 domain-containing protein n=1 Tax=Gemmata massiliana TaxID=1210884 RepID=A0A6P2CZ32_9BACT|nr:YsnF/AvaK domain-containing protein [Gemmata massiliana]VTR94113.1 Uncharacterized protein OS=Singulisphaera acidiphila (strain ATCC BAA-1392 / DSM 18658 / VKM B-2454 / MOB10) GN=Sinac_4599 PE=4 SV=1: DUF2382 [Gemmata massiliana]
MTTRKKKHNTAVGVFETKARAEQAISELKAHGFTDSEIGMVYRNAEGETVKSGAANNTYAEEGAVAGAVAGGGALALGSLAVSFGVIPVIGPILAVGPLAAALISAAGGAAAGGIAGALIGWGVPEEDAEFYQNEVQAGRYLVTVETGDRLDEARNMLHRYSGFDRNAWAAVRADRANTLAEGSFQTEDGRVIQLKKEHLRADKETVSAGEVKVRKEVHTEHKQITVPVEREEVVIERRPASGKRVSGAELEAEEIRIPTKEERVHVTKEAVLKEEVSVGKRKVHDTKTVAGDVREEELVVESEGEAKVRQNSRKK